jgi:hypothetical protein
MGINFLRHRPQPARQPGNRSDQGSRRSFVPRLEPLENRTVPSTLTVLNNADSGAGSLRAAIQGAHNGDTVVFAPALNGQTITLTSDQLTINKSLDIEGPGASLLTINGNDTNRIFDITEGLTVTVDGLTITHGRANGGNGNAHGAGGGGAILNVGSILSLANDAFSANVSVGSDGPKGGAIATFGSGSLTVTDSTFISNLADGRVKNGPFAEGGAIFSGRDGPNVTVVRCTFTGNEAIGGDGGQVAPGGYAVGAANGGALHVEGSSTLTVIDSHFIDNQAIAGSGGSAPKGTNAGSYNVDCASGGAVVSDDGATLLISGSTFLGNKSIAGSNAVGASAPFAFLASSGGGAVSSEGPVTMTGSTFLANQALGGSNVAGGTGMIRVGGGFGGAIHMDLYGSPMPFTVANCSFASNKAIGGVGDSGGILAGQGIGGGLAFFNMAGSTANTGTIAACSFSANQAIGGQGSTGRNGADGLGGAIANVFSATCTISGCTFSGNQAIGGAGGSGANGGNALAGGLYNDGASTLSVTASTITANHALGGAAGSGGSAGLGEGGGAYFAAGGVVCLDLFTETNAAGNTASTSGNDLFGAFTIC